MVTYVDRCIDNKNNLEECPIKLFYDFIDEIYGFISRLNPIKKPAIFAGLMA
jgi:hypothetical protein